MCPIDELSEQLRPMVEGDVATVHQIFSGPVAGDALLILDGRSAGDPQRAADQRAGAAARRSMPRPARSSTEVGNILLNACLGTFGNVLKVQVSFSVPHLTLESLDGVMSSIAVGHEGLRYALVVHAAFRLRGSSLIGYVVIVLSVASIDRLVRARRRLGTRASMKTAEDSGSGVMPAQAAMVRWFLETTHQGLFATDADFQVLAWNRWMQIHTGRAASDVVGRPLFEAFPELVARELDRCYRDALEGRVTTLSQGLHRYVLPLAPTHADLGLPQMPQSGQIGPLMDGDRVIGTVTTIDNVSDRLASEAELRKQIEAQRTGALRCRGCAAFEGRVPVHAVPRAPSAAQCRARLDAHSHGAAGRRSGRDCQGPASHRPQCDGPGGDDRRHPRCGAGRRRQAAAGSPADRPAAGGSRRRRRDHAVGHGQAHRHHDDARRRHTARAGRCRPPSADRLESALERGQVHRSGRQRSTSGSPLRERWRASS